MHALTGWRRRLTGSRAVLYRWSLGSLMGSRFALLTSCGCRPGPSRFVVVEVVEGGAGAGLVVVALAGDPHWFLGSQPAPHVRVDSDGCRWDASVRPMGRQECGRAMVRYAEHRPRAAFRLAHRRGVEADGTAARWFEIGRDVLPFVEASPMPQLCRAVRRRVRE